MVGMVCCCNYMSEGGGGTGMFSSENWLLDRLVNALRMVDVVTLMMSWPVFFSLWEGIDKLRTLNISKEVRMSSKSLCCCDTGKRTDKTVYMACGTILFDEKSISATYFCGLSRLPKISSVHLCRFSKCKISNGIAYPFESSILVKTGDLINKWDSFWLK